MKTLKAVIVGSALAALLSACVPSVYPFYTAKDVIFDEGLLGEWQTDNGKETQVWKFERDKDQGYKLTVTEDGGKTGVMEARLFRLEGQSYLDLLPADCQFADDQASLIEASVFPGHLLARVSRHGKELKVSFFDFDWLQKHLEANPKSLAHHRQGDRTVLTAETRELQRFVARHGKEGELFPEASVFKHRQ